MVWAQFIACAIILFVAGARLAKYAHILSVRTKLGGLWIGLILTATITSMPETVAAVSAAGLFNNPDLALSTLYGGNTFNLALIAVMDIMYWKQPLLKVISHRHIKLLLGGILLLIITGAAIFLGPEADWIIGPVAMISLLLLSMYLFVLYQQHKYPQADEEADGNSYLEYTLRSLGLRLAGAAAAVVLAGIWLSYVGDRIAAETTLSSTFTGSLFLGISTSAPEMIVSFTALRIGARELAVANLTGSILYRSAAIVLPDLFYPGRSIFAAASTSNLIIVVAAVIMSLLVIAGLRWPGPRKAFVAGWYTPFLLAVYFGSLYLLFTGNSG